MNMLFHTTHTYMHTREMYATWCTLCMHTVAKPQKQREQNKLSSPTFTVPEHSLSPSFFGGAFGEVKQTNKKKTHIHKSGQKLNRTKNVLLFVPGTPWKVLWRAVCSCRFAIGIIITGVCAVCRQLRPNLHYYQLAHLATGTMLSVWCVFCEYFLHDFL